MKPTLILTAALVLVSGLCRADDGDETLERWLSKSDLVVLGTIVTRPSCRITEEGVPNYICRFKVSVVCKGDVGLEGKTIPVNIKRFEMSKKDHHPLIEKGARCILFLRKQRAGTAPRWVTADFWFGLQHPFPHLAKSLKRLAEREDREREGTKAGGK